MTQLFNAEERAVVRNLDLLQKATGLFIRAGMAGAIETRLRVCVGRHARKMGLRMVEGFDKDEGTNGEPSVEAEEISWPYIWMRAVWQGRSQSKWTAPQLSFSVRADVYKLRSPSDSAIEIALWYPPLGQAIGDQKQRDRLADQYHFLPDAERWSRKLGGALRFVPRDVGQLSMDTNALLRGRTPPSLKEVCPALASVFDEYLRICECFEELEHAEGLKLRSPRRAVAVSEVCAPPRWERSPETEYLRHNNSSLLQAAYLYEGDLPERKGIRDRIKEFLCQAIQRKCSDARLRVTKGTIFKDMPRDSDFKPRWALYDDNLSIAIICHCVPSTTETTTVRLEVRVYVNSIVAGRKKRSLEPFRSAWNESRAAVMFEPCGDVRWKLKNAKMSHRFWGYWTELDVDLQALSEGTLKAIACIEKVLSAVIDASNLYKNKSRRRVRKK